MDIELFIGWFDVSFNVQYSVTMKSGALVECDVKEGDLVFTAFIREFDGVMERVDFLHESKELVLSPSPDDKYIINQPFP